jgi:glutamate N-acetyltransferase/amino-acid N-acetyltransferase
MSHAQLAFVHVDEPSDGDPDATQFSFDSALTGGRVTLADTLEHQPEGLRSAALKAGIKYADTLDFMVVTLPAAGPAAGVFTRNRSCSPAVTLDRAHLADGSAQTLVVISKNANVFTPTAMDDTRAIVNAVAKRLGVRDVDVLTSATGVIGVSLPMAKVHAAIDQLPGALRDGLQPEVASAILTTDRGPKVASARFGDVVLAGMAKGAGMIEPNMATMLVYFFTNLDVPSDRLGALVKRAVDATFNAISVDTDTSTSDSLIVFSTGSVPTSPDAERDLEACLTAMSLKLAREVVYQAEGATKLIEAHVHGAPSDDDAKAMAKQIINSPLMKAAVFGADPNWGRVVMAIGKPGPGREALLDPAEIRIAINGSLLFDRGAAVPLDLGAVSASIRDRKKVVIDVAVGAGAGAATVWGCDLTYEYVKVNAEYTT